MFGFQEVKRESYKSSFLRKVILEIEYPQITNLNNHIEEIKAIFVEDFPRFNLGTETGFHININQDKTDFRELKGNNRLLFKSSDGKKDLEFGCENLILSIDGRSYKFYEEILEKLQKIVSIFETLKVSQLLKLTLRKINLVDFEFNDSLPPNGIFQVLLNNEISSANDIFPRSNNISMSLHNVDFLENSYKLNLKYGMNTFNPEKKIGQLVVDMKMTIDKQLNITDIEKEATVINNQLFDVFYWIFNDNAKNILKGGS